MNTDTIRPTDTITVTVNGESLRLLAGASVADAARASGVKPPFAAAVNLAFVPKASCDQLLLRDGDAVELISPITGG